MGTHKTSAKGQREFDLGKKSRFRPILDTDRRPNASSVQTISRIWVDVPFCGMQTSGCWLRPLTATKALRSQSLLLPGRHKQMSSQSNQRAPPPGGREPPGCEDFRARTTARGKKVESHVPKISLPEFFCVPPLRICSEPFSKILSQWSIQATWPGTFQPRLYIRIPLGSIQEIQPNGSRPGPLLDHHLKLNL